MKRHLWIAAAILLSACASGNQRDQGPMSIAPPAYSSAAGESAVGAIPEAFVRDSGRNKHLQLSIEYPIKGGPFPVVVFSPAMGASSRDYVGLGAYWASNGYVVVKVTHADARTAPGIVEGREAAAMQSAPEWANRAADLALVLDSVTLLEEQYPELKGKLDLTRVGVAGHAYGAFTALLLGGMKTFTDTAPTTFKHPRVKAIVAVSPHGPSRTRGLTRDSWSDLRLPVLFVTGTSDRGETEGEDMAWRKQAFDLSPAGEKWFVAIEGANHMTLSGRFIDPTVVREMPIEPTVMDSRGRIVQQQPRSRIEGGFGADQSHFNRLRAVTLAFWDAYLKPDPKGREYLTSLAGRGAAQVESK